MRIEHAAHSLNATAGIVIILLAVFLEPRLPLPAKISKPSGLSAVITGMSLVIWSVCYLRAGFFGRVKPPLDALVKKGPYRFVRHPIYLGWTIALAGVSLAARNWIALIGVFILFIPSAIFRARLEERALNEKFGSDWKRYAEKTGFIVPRAGKASRNQE